MLRDTYKITFEGIPVYDPQVKYKFGDVAYFPENDRVAMFIDRTNAGSIGDTRWIIIDTKPVGMLHEVRHDLLERGRYPWGSRETQYSKVPRDWLKIKNVIFNDPATIVFWTDGTKTVVKCANEEFDPEKGLVMAIAKKALGNEGNYYNQLKKWLPEEENCQTVTVPGFQEALERVKNIGDHIKDAIDTIDTMLGDEEE